jgi:hypothetical protein
MFPPCNNSGPSVSEQQRIERHYFERFRKIYPLPSQSVTFGDKPDVILTGERKVGIEITNFYATDGARPESEQRQRQRRESVVSRAQALYERASGKNIELTFGFDEAHPIGSRNAQRALVDKLVQIARRAEGPEENGQIRAEYLEETPEVNFAYVCGHYLEYEPFPDPEFPDGPPDNFPDFRRYMNRQDEHARRVGVRRPLPHPTKWKAIKVHSGGLLPLDRVVEIVRIKEAKAKAYTTCDAYWLLVIVDFCDPAQDREIRIDGFDTFRSQVFEKVIVYRPYFEHILENGLAQSRTML